MPGGAGCAAWVRVRHGHVRALPMAFAMLAAGTLAAEPPDGRVTENVVLVTLDGVRIQDFFGGLDDAVAAHDATQLYSDIGAMRERYGAATAAERRARLMPELWTRLLPQGMAFGNVAHGNHVKVRNGVYWSTPGYVEMLTGAPRREVRDNDFRRYPYPTALDLAREAPGMSFGQVAQFGSWDGFALAASRSDEGFLMLGAYDDLPAELGTPGVAALNEIRREVMGLWEEGSNDMLTYRMAKAYVQQHRPRVLWLAFVNSDDWAHADRYDRYLEYLHRADAMLGDLWTTLQSEDAYRDRTTLVVTTDHGRGLGAGWAEHDASIPGSDDIWLAVIGPDTP
ncbi:MAG TPA: hypothetical protein VFY03_03200, partial [Woeseiaceae bacterium]|nr:hypothetical protein [Woeseiaceae bacterium]